MSNALALVWDLIAVDQASPTFARVGTAAEGTAAKTEGATAAIGGFLKVLGVVAAGAVVVESVKAAANFQKSMLLVQTQAGATSKEVADMSPKILALAGQVAQAPEALATSLYHVESTGLRGAAAIEAVKVAAEGAKVGNADLEQTTNALTATIASGMLPATETYAQAMGQLNTIVGSGDMKMQDLNDSLSSGLLVTVKQYGVNLNDVGAALADFGDNNLRGADAATRLRMAVQALATQSAQGQGVLLGLGIKVNQLADDMAKGGLNLAIQDLMQHLKDSGVAADKWGQVLTEAFTKKAGAGVLTLIGTFDRFQQKYQEVSKGADTFGAAWQATTHNASFQFSQLKDTVDALGIKLGTALLKPLGDLAQWLSQTGIPDVQKFSTGVSGLFSSIEHSQAWTVFWSDAKMLFTDARDDLEKLVTSFTRSGGLHDVLLDVRVVGGVALAALKGLNTVAADTVGVLVHWFGELPGPVQAAVVAFAALRIATALGWFDMLIAGGGKALTMMRSVGAGAVTMSMQMSTAFGEAKSAQLALLGEGGLGGTMIARASGNLAGLGAAAGEAAKGGFTALKSAGSGVVSILGGPWGAAMLGATVAISLVASTIDKAKTTTDQWTQSLKEGGNAADQVKGQMADVQQQIDRNHAGFMGLINTIDGYNFTQEHMALPDPNKAKQAFQSWYDSLDRVGKAQEAVTQATSHYNDVAGQYGPASEQAQSAARQLQQANQELKTTQDDVNTATQTHLDLLKQQSDAELAAVNSSLAAMEAQGQLDSAIAQYNRDASDGQHTTAQLKAESANLATQTIETAKAVAQHAADQAKANGVTDTTIVYQNMLHDTLQGYVGQLTGPVRTAVQQAADATAGATVKTDDFRDAVSKLGLNVAVTWPQGTKVVQDATSQQIEALRQLGYHVTTLPGSDPNHPQTIYVTTDTSAAYTGLTDFLKKAQDLGFVGALHGLAPIGIGAGGNNGGNPVGLPPIPGHADGGYTGPGPKFTPAGIVHAGEIVWSQSDIAAHGGVSAVESLRTARGYANGGLVWPAEINPSLTSQWNSTLTSLTNFAGTGAGSPFMKILGQAIAASMGYAAQFGAIDYIFSHESGWNPLAQNPTSTAFGIPQFLNSTWGAYGGKTTDAAAQIRDGIEYMRDRYGSPASAAAFWAAHHWYRDGTDYVPSDQLAYLHRGEAVVPASRNQGAPYQGGRTGPLMHVEHQHINDQVDIDLALREAQFRDRVGVFS